MKRVLLFGGVLSMVFIIACSKSTNLPTYTPSPAIIFSVSTLKHTADSVNVGDTIRLTATGRLYDTTQNVYVYLAATTGTSVVSLGTVASPITVAKTIGATDSTGLYTWSSTVSLPNATIVHKTTLTVTANFLYQLTLSSQLGTLSVADAGIKNKTVYVR